MLTYRKLKLLESMVRTQTPEGKEELLLSLSKNYNESAIGMFVCLYHIMNMYAYILNYQYKYLNIYIYIH